MTNPLTTAERTGIRNWANLQFAIAHRYKDVDPVRSEFYHGRSVAAGKIAGQYNPRIHPKRHNYAWIGKDEKYEYAQCQWPSCNKVVRIDLKTGNVEEIKLKDIPDSVLANPKVVGQYNPTPKSVATVNSVLRKLGHKERLAKGKGYYYWYGGEANKFQDTGVYVYRLSALTVEQWIGDLMEKKGKLANPIIPAPRPTEYKVIRKGEHYPYEVKCRSPRTGRWELAFTHDDIDFINRWFKSRGINLTAVRMPNPKGAKLGPRPKCVRCGWTLSKADYWYCKKCGATDNPKGVDMKNPGIPDYVKKFKASLRYAYRHSALNMFGKSDCKTLTPDEIEKVLDSLLKDYYPLRPYPPGSYEKITKDEFMSIFRDTFKVEIKKMRGNKNPTGLYKSFHGVDPVRHRRVYYQPPPKKLISIGELSRIDYKPVRGTHKNTQFFHHAGDLGEKTIKTNLILATDPEGRHLYLVKKDKSVKYPIFSARGILG